jgi:hypothetical protein
LIYSSATKFALSSKSFLVNNLFSEKTNIPQLKENKMIPNPKLKNAK